MRRVMFSIGLALVVSSCQYLPSPIPPNPYDPPEDCAPACANLEKMKCPGWQGSPGDDGVFGTPDDVSCVDVCVDTMEEPTATLHPKCTAAAESCEAVEECFANE